MTLYRGIITSAAIMAGIPGGPTTNRTIAVAKICETILGCFVLPIKDLGIETILQIARVNITAVVEEVIDKCTLIVIEGAGDRPAGKYGDEHRSSLGEKSSRLSESAETAIISTAFKSKEDSSRH